MFDPEAEGPSEADVERFGEETRSCPECGEAMHDEAPLCPSCGHAIADRPGGRQPAWVIAGLVAALIGFVLVFAL